MSRLYVDPDARHPLYTSAMPLSRVVPGTQFVTLDTQKGKFDLTILASEWRTEFVQLVSGNCFPLRCAVVRLQATDINDDVIDLCEKGIHPPVEANDLWNLRNFSVLADRNNILSFYPWLVREGFARAANEIQDRFFDFFVDNDVFWDKLMRQANA